MNNNFWVLVGVVAGFVLAFAGFYFIVGLNVNKVPVVPYGSGSGQTHYFAEEFIDDLRAKSPVSTGASTTLTSGATVSITAAQACDSGIINFDPATPTVGSTTLPTAATLKADCLTTIGDKVTFTFRNVSTATTTQLKAGSNIVLVAVSAAEDIIAASGWSLITLQNLDGTNVVAIVEALADSD